MQTSQSFAIVPVETVITEEKEVTRVVIDLANEAEVRRFHRVILAGSKNVSGSASEAFANALVEALGVTEESAAKR